MAARDPSSHTRAWYFLTGEQAGQPVTCIPLPPMQHVQIEMTKTRFASFRQSEMTKACSARLSDQCGWLNERRPGISCRSSSRSPIADLPWREDKTELRLRSWRILTGMGLWNLCIERSRHGGDDGITSYCHDRLFT